MSITLKFKPLIDEAQHRWLGGESNVLVIRRIYEEVAVTLPGAGHLFVASDIYRAAFHLGFNAVHAVWSVRGGSGEEDWLNQHLDDMIAEVRLGGRLTAARIAAHLDLPLHEVEAIFQLPENGRRMGCHYRYDENHNQIGAELFATASLLHELEASCDPPRPHRYPYWHGLPQQESLSQLNVFDHRQEGR